MERVVAFDTGVAQRVLGLAAEAASPRGAHAEDLAALRICLYAGPAFIVPTVAAELGARRRDLEALGWFELVADGDAAYRGRVKGRTERYLDVHPDPRDCRVVAEAESGGMRVLVTLKADLLSGLTGRVESIELQTPSVYWGGLNVPEGVEPLLSPPPAHALSRATWWKW